MESYLIHCRPKATIFATSCSAEKQFSCQIQSLCGCQGQKCKSEWRTRSSSLGGLSQEPADSRWETPRHPCAALVSSSKPNTTSRCCWLNHQANPALPVHISGEKRVWLRPLLSCSGPKQGSPWTAEKFSRSLPWNP